MGALSEPGEAGNLRKSRETWALFDRKSPKPFFLLLCLSAAHNTVDASCDVHTRPPKNNAIIK